MFLALGHIADATPIGCFRPIQCETRSGLRKQKHVCMLLDAAYKISCSNWGLLVAAIPNKRCNKDFAASEAVIVALGWVPEESSTCLAHWLITFLDICEEAGLKLRHQLRAILVDGAKGTIAGAQQAGSLIVYCRQMNPQTFPVL